MSGLRLSLFWPLFLAGLGVPRPAHAESPDESRRLDLEGTAEMDAGRYDVACPKLERSYRIEPGLGVLLRLAQCHERAHRTASAWSRYREAAGLARTRGDAAIEQLALRRMASLDAALEKVTLIVPPASELRVWLDGVALETEAPSDSPLPVDPGGHTLVAEARGMRRFTTTFSSPGPGARLTVRVRLEPSTPVVAPAAPAPGAPSARRRAPPPAAPWPWQRATGLALGIAGSATLVTGAVAGTWALVTMNRARDLCPEKVDCSADAMSLQEDARRKAVVANVAVAGGAALTLGGLVLWLASPERAPAADRAALRVSPALSESMRGVVAAGTF